MAVKTVAVIDAPIAKVWGVISDYAGLKNWHPMVKECTTTGEGNGAVRKVSFGDWWVDEELVDLDEANHSFGYLITDGNRPETLGARGSMALKSLGPDSTELTWQTKQAEGNPLEAEIDKQLQGYYPTRVNHLRAALRLPAKD